VGKIQISRKTEKIWVKCCYNAVKNRLIYVNRVVLLDLVREVVAMNRNLLDYLLNGRSSSESTNLMNLFNTQMSKEINDLRDVIIELREQISRNQEQHTKDIRDILNRTHQNRTSINQTTSTSSSSQTEVKSQTVATQTKVKLQKTIDTQTEIEPESPNIPTTSISSMIFLNS
jgi:hypothetical protein